MSKNYIITTLIIVATILLGWFFVTKNTPSEQSMNNNSVSNELPAPGNTNVEEIVIVSDTPSTDQLEKTKSVEIIYGTNGFSPREITIAPETEVTFINRSSGPMWVASNVHPIHTNYPKFDQLSTGNTYSFTFTEKGIYNYHNHLNPSEGGKIIVK